MTASFGRASPSVHPNTTDMSLLSSFDGGKVIVPITSHIFSSVSIPTPIGQWIMLAPPPPFLAPNITSFSYFTWEPTSSTLSPTSTYHGVPIAFSLPAYVVHDFTLLSSFVQPSLADQSGLFMPSYSHGLLAMSSTIWTINVTHFITTPLDEV